MQRVLLALKQGASDFPRYIAVREIYQLPGLCLYMREFGAKKPNGGNGMQFAPL
jgi:hypothetical protein